MSVRYSRRAAVATIGAVILVLVGKAYQYAPGLSLVVRGANLTGFIRTVANLDTVHHEEHLVRIPMRLESIAGRAYVPTRGSRQTVLVVAGLHPAGIDEPRLMALSRELAKSKVTVVTPEIRELSRFEITPTDQIEQAALWLTTSADLTPTGRIGLMGISFSGGLSVVAAGRPVLRDRLSYVFAFGGHDDLPRVLTYLCTGVEGGPTIGPWEVDPATVQRPPHDYGVAVVLLNVADHLVPPEQVAVLRDAVRRFLWASYLDAVDAPAAAREFVELRTLARGLPEPRQRCSISSTIATWRTSDLSCSRISRATSRPRRCRLHDHQLQRRLCSCCTADRARSSRLQSRYTWRSAFGRNRYPSVYS